MKTFVFKDRLSAQAEPGQFVMVWVPGVDEVPMSVSGTYPNGLASVTVAKVGEATEALHGKAIGDVIGVRGPFGSRFAPSDGNVLVVGGGTGLAPLAFLAERLVKVSKQVTFLLGAKSRDGLLFLDKVKKTLSTVNGRVVAVTEDGSYGLKGVVVDPVRNMLEEERFDMIYTCGPELMMYRVFLLAEGYGAPLQASLERLMRCAVGLCGSCVIGKYMVCRDGPVFTEKQLREVRDEFGSLKRDFDGRMISI